MNRFGLYVNQLCSVWVRHGSYPRMVRYSSYEPTIFEA